MNIAVAIVLGLFICFGQIEARSRYGHYGQKGWSGHGAVAQVIARSRSYARAGHSGSVAHASAWSKAGKHYRAHHPWKCRPVHKCIEDTSPDFLLNFGNSLTVETLTPEDGDRCNNLDLCVRELASCINNSSSCQTSFGRELTDRIASSNRSEDEFYSGLSPEQRNNFESVLESYIDNLREKYPNEWISVRDELSFLSLSEFPKPDRLEVLKSEVELQNATRALADKCLGDKECVIRFMYCLEEDNDVECDDDLGQDLSATLRSVNNGSNITTLCPQCTQEELNNLIDVYRYYFTSVRNRYPEQWINIRKHVTFLDIESNELPTTSIEDGENLDRSTVNQNAQAACLADKECSTSLTYCIMDESLCMSDFGREFARSVQAVYETGCPSAFVKGLCKEDAENFRKVLRQYFITLRRDNPYQWLVVRERFAFLDETQFPLPQRLTDFGQSLNLTDNSRCDADVCAEDEECLTRLMFCSIGDEVECSGAFGGELSEDLRAIKNGAEPQVLCPECTEEELTQLIATYTYLFSTIRERYPSQWVNIRDQVTFLEIEQEISENADVDVNEDVFRDEDALEGCLDDEECTIRLTYCILDKDNCEFKFGRDFAERIDKVVKTGNETYLTEGISDEQGFRAYVVEYIEYMRANEPYQWMNLRRRFAFLPESEFPLTTDLQNSGTNRTIDDASSTEVQNCVNDEDCAIAMSYCLLEKDECQTDLGHDLKSRLDEANEEFCRTDNRTLAVEKLCIQDCTSSSEEVFAKLNLFFQGLDSNYPILYESLEKEWVNLAEPMSDSGDDDDGDF